jgi:hypothetical protein
VRRAFAALGHEAWSCDLLSSEGSNKHLIGDVREFLNDGWDLLMVAHPPCTRLCNSGVRWLSVPPPGKTREQMWAELEEGAALFSDCLNAPIERIAAENPVMHKHAKALIRNYVPAAQFVQPWWFGHPAFKATGLHLRRLPRLVPTNKLTPSPGTPEHKAWSQIHRAPPGPNRWRDRSRFWPGIAQAMARQWTAHINSEMRRAA